MKWIVFTAACVTSLVALGILAVDERDVVWEAKRPYCPYCRHELNYYALACEKCSHTLDWVSTRERCPWCLDDDEAVRIRNDFLDLGIDGRAMPEPLREFTDAYFRDFQAGDCACCGGLGEVKVNGGGEHRCPVCFGRKRCIACNGDGYTVRGDLEAHRRKLEREEVREAWIRRAELLEQLPPLDRILAEDVADLAGYVEAIDLRDAEGRCLVELARDRAKRALQGLRAALGAANGKPRAPGGPEPAVRGS